MKKKITVHRFKEGKGYHCTTVVPQNKAVDVIKAIGKTLHKGQIKPYMRKKKGGKRKCVTVKSHVRGKNK